MTSSVKIQVEGLTNIFDEDTGFPLYNALLESALECISNELDEVELLSTAERQDVMSVVYLRSFFILSCHLASNPDMAEERIQQIGESTKELFEAALQDRAEMVNDVLQQVMGKGK